MGAVFLSFCLLCISYSVTALTFRPFSPLSSFSSFSKNVLRASKYQLQNPLQRLQSQKLQRGNRLQLSASISFTDERTFLETKTNQRLLYTLPNSPVPVESVVSYIHKWAEEATEQGTSITANKNTEGVIFSFSPSPNSYLNVFVDSFGTYSEDRTFADESGGLTVYIRTSFGLLASEEHSAEQKKKDQVHSLIKMVAQNLIDSLANDIGSLIMNIPSQEDRKEPTPQEKEEQLLEEMEREQDEYDRMMEGEDENELRSQVYAEQQSEQQSERQSERESGQQSAQEGGQNGILNEKKIEKKEYKGFARSAPSSTSIPSTSTPPTFSTPASASSASSSSSSSFSSSSSSFPPSSPSSSASPPLRSSSADFFTSSFSETENQQQQQRYNQREREIEYRKEQLRKETLPTDQSIMQEWSTEIVTEEENLKFKDDMRMRRERSEAEEDSFDNGLVDFDSVRRVIENEENEEEENENGRETFVWNDGDRKNVPQVIETTVVKEEKNVSETTVNTEKNVPQKPEEKIVPQMVAVKIVPQQDVKNIPQSEEKNVLSEDVSLERNGGEQELYVWRNVDTDTSVIIDFIQGMILLL